MEDRQILSEHRQQQWGVQSKITQEWSQGFKDTMQLENRLKILQIEKQKKIKEIQKKLGVHKRNVQLKILKHERHQAVANMHQQQRMNVTSYHTRFKTEKQQRSQNIHKLREQMRKTKNQQFWSVKKQAQEISRKMAIQKAYEKQQNVKKRNKVRLMQIQAKQNVVSSWNRRLNQMKHSRQIQVDKKLKQHQTNLSMMAEMGKKQHKILEEIYKAEDMEKQLGEMIGNETMMNGAELSRLYQYSE